MIFFQYHTSQLQFQLPVQPRILVAVVWSLAGFGQHKVCVKRQPEVIKYHKRILFEKVEFVHVKSSRSEIRMLLVFRMNREYYYQLV